MQWFFFWFQNLQKKAEELIEKYEYNQDLTLDKVNYTNVNNVSMVKNGMERSDHFKQDVHYQLSGVHVPLEIYEGCEYFLHTNQLILLISQHPLFLSMFFIFQFLTIEWQNWLTQTKGTWGENT